MWNLILLDGVNRDLRLVPCLVLRGVGSEASAAVRRALEHTGVLAHIWAEPTKVEALEDTDSKDYEYAFRREKDSHKAKALKHSKTTKRFAAMKLGPLATLLWNSLSTTDIHGGTSARFFLYTANPGDLACSFAIRLDAGSEGIGRQISFLVNAHRTTCGEIMNLCADYAEPSEELGAAALAFKMFAQPSGEPSVELREHIRQLRNRLGIGGASTIHCEKDPH